MRKRGASGPLRSRKSMRTSPFKAAMVAIVEATLGINIQTRANLITAKFPPNQRKFKKLQRDLNKVLDCMADGLHEAAQRTKELS